MNNKWMMIIFPLLVLLMLLTGCDKNKKHIKDTHAFIAKLKTTAQQKSDALAITTEKMESTIYRAHKQRQPFAQANAMVNDTSATSQIKENSLHNYHIANLTLAGILSEGQQKWALITAPDKKSYQVSVGSIVGLEAGKVETITANEVILYQGNKVVKLIMKIN